VPPLSLLLLSLGRRHQSVVPPFRGYSHANARNAWCFPLSAPYGVVEVRVQYLSVCCPPFPSGLGASPHRHSRIPPCTICTGVESWSVIPTMLPRWRAQRASRLPAHICSCCVQRSLQAASKAFHTTHLRCGRPWPNAMRSHLPDAMSRHSSPLPVLLLAMSEAVDKAKPTHTECERGSV
jgi:hypothetical protein